VITAPGSAAINVHVHTSKAEVQAPAIFSGAAVHVVVGHVEVEEEEDKQGGIWL
jgi:hypothetical protein